MSNFSWSGNFWEFKSIRRIKYQITLHFFKIKELFIRFFARYSPYSVCELVNHQHLFASYPDFDNVIH